jgi:starch synthase (maltosyl-transferring)
MKSWEESRRIAIKNVYPEIDCGRYPVKRVIGEKFTVRADIFADAHDEVKAFFFHRVKGKRKWNIELMHSLGNDRWESSFIPNKHETYEYTVAGMVDHFSTWQHALKKKSDAGQDISNELKIGVQIINDTASKQTSALQKQLLQLSKEISLSNENDALEIALDENTSLVMAQTINVNNDVTQYSKILTIEIDRLKALYSSWYEFFPRSTSGIDGKHGTFKDCEKVIPEIARMGFDVVYFPPIHPIGVKFRKGKNNSLKAGKSDSGSPWAIGSAEGGHKSIHPELGSEADFRQLVKRAEKEGIEIALDLAFQCSPDHPYIKEHPEWFNWRPDGTIQYAENPPKKYQDIVPVNFETNDWQNLWRELKSIVDHWIGFGVKIFRVDNPHTKPFVFWQWLISEVKKKNKDVLFLAEAFTRPRIMEQLAKTGFHQSYTYFTWRNTREEIMGYVNELVHSELREYFRPNFWPNTPDILPASLEHKPASSFIQRLILSGTLSASYGVYGPVYELGINEPHPGKEEYTHNEKYELKSWDWNISTPIKDVMIKLNRIRKENPALQTTWNLHFADVDNQQLLCYAKHDDSFENILFIAVNLDHKTKQAGWTRVPLERLQMQKGIAYTVHDLLTGNKYTWRDEWNYIELNPLVMTAHIFRIEFNT